MNTLLLAAASYDAKTSIFELAAVDSVCHDTLQVHRRFLSRIGYITTEYRPASMSKKHAASRDMLRFLRIWNLEIAQAHARCKTKSYKFSLRPISVSY